MNNSTSLTTSKIDRAAIPFLIFLMFLILFMIIVFCVICIKRCCRWYDNHKIYAIDIYQPQEPDNKVHVIDVYPQQK